MIRRTIAFRLRSFRPARLVAAAAVFFFLATAAGPLAAGPRLDPRLNSLLHFLVEEKSAGREPRMLSPLNADGSLVPGTRAVTGSAGPTLAVDCILDLGESGREALARRGIRVHTPAGRFATATLTVEELEAVAGLAEVRAVEMSKPLKPYLDVSAPAINATIVHGGRGPDYPASGFTGRHVIVGLVDTGIDFRHRDFRNLDGTTRIRWIWDQRNNAGPHPAGFGSFGGTEWSEAQINSAITNNTLIESDDSGHGTHVAGIAAGNGSDTGNGQPAYQYIGIAPEADIIEVRTTFQTGDVLDALDYIFTRANGQDAVVNLSLGTQDGPHDGTSVFDKAIADRLGPGKIVAAAAGNESNQGIHARLTMAPAADSVVFTFSIPPYTAAAGAENDVVYLDGWYDGADNFSFLVESPSGWRSREVLNNQNMTACSTLPGGEGRVYAENNYLQGNPAPANGDREIYIEVTDRSNTCGNPAPGIWKIVAYRKAPVTNGIIDFWVAGTQLGNGNASAAFLQGASNDYLVGSPASANGVLSAGAYITKRLWPTPNGNRQYQGITDADIGKIASFSSPGPLRNGTIAPTIAAPGMGIASSKSAQGPADPDHTLPDEKHIINQGTSQASPHLAGSAALILERCPHLSPAQILDRITNTAIHDRFTGNQPNNVYGYGKLNVLGAINYQTPTLACAIQGDSIPDLGATVTYTDNSSDTRNHQWSLTSTPPGIATIVDTPTDRTVRVHFTASGSARVILAVSDLSAAEVCRTVCEKDVVVGLGFFSALDAAAVPGGIRIHWHLADNAPAFSGFYVARANQADGPFVRLTPDSLTGGPDFEFVDTTVQPGNEYWYIIEGIIPGGVIRSVGPILAVAGAPKLFLAQNRPNPFHETTRIEFLLAHAGPVTVQLFDLNGELVRTLAPAGANLFVEWDGTNQQGRRVPPGIYFYQLKAGSQKLTRKMLLVK